MTSSISVHLGQFCKCLRVKAHQYAFFLSSLADASAGILIGLFSVYLFFFSSDYRINSDPHNLGVDSSWIQL